MPLFSASDVASVIEDTGGVEVVFAGITTYGHVDEIEEVDVGSIGGVGVVTRSRTVLIATGILTTLAAGEFPTVDGTEYRVERMEQENDGLETRVWLADVTLPS